MIKSKRFMPILAMIAIVFAVGNWAVPVQATGAIISTATPTSTPIIEPMNAQGESVAAEQQEEIKEVIQSYFEVRYQALSISQPDGYRQNGFGDLVSAEEVGGMDFLNAELGKLALEIRYAELNHARYVEYKYFLNYSDFIIDPDTQLVIVSVVEDNEVVYEISVERNPTDPHVTRNFGVNHKIVLRGEQGQWRIISDQYNDYLWRILRRTGKSTNEMLERLETRQVPPFVTPNSENAEQVVTSLLPSVLQAILMTEMVL